MAIQSENNIVAKKTAKMKFSPWMEQELPFADAPCQLSDESGRETLEPMRGENVPRLVEPEIENPVDLHFEGEREEDSDIGNPLSLSPARERL